MTDVFVRVHCENWLRAGMAFTSIERWKIELDIDLTFICTPPKDSAIELSLVHHFPSHCLLPLFQPDNFWTRAKQYAEERAQSPIYVLADDDQLIIGKDWVRRGVEILEQHPEYGLLSAWSINGEIPERPSDDPEVFPIGSNCGCPYFIRKGIVQKFPDAPIGQQDHAMCEIIKAKGWKIGFLKTVRYNHLGAHYSTAIPENWSA